YPGSELHEELVRDGKIVKDASYPELLKSVYLDNLSGTMSWTPRISARSLRNLSIFGILLFYFSQFLFRPYRLLGMARRIYLNRPVTVLELQLAHLLPRVLRGLRIRFR